MAETAQQKAEEKIAHFKARFAGTNGEWRDACASQAATMQRHVDDGLAAPTDVEAEIVAWRKEGR